MKSATQWSRLAASVLVTGALVAVVVVLPGCAPAPEPSGGPQAPAAPDLTSAPETPAEPGAAEGQAEPEPAEGAKPEAAEKPAAAELSLAPPVSTYAPAEDLVAQVAAYIEDLDEAVANEGEYNDSVEKLAKDSNTLILIALALGLHDQDNQHKAASPAMIQAAQQLASAADYASAKAAIEAFKAAAASTEGNPGDLKWEKLASLPELMEAVPLIHTRMKRYFRSEDRLKGAVDDLAGWAAVLGVIAQGSMANAGDTDQPDEVEKWHAFCVQMRDASAATNAAVRAFGKEGGTPAFDAATAAMKDLAQSCDDCHEVFHPDE